MRIFAWDTETWRIVPGRTAPPRVCLSYCWDGGDKGVVSASEGLAMLRFHSFYPWHREGCYDYLLNDHDRAMLPSVLRFNPYDLYTKSHEKPDSVKLRPFYEELIREYFPDKVRW